MAESDSSVIVEGVSKRFKVYTERPPSLKHRILSSSRGRPREHWALRDVSFEVPEGSMYALIGHNGSGKSTLLRLIAGIYQPTSGKIVTKGRISALLELGAGFHPDLTGRENVYLNASLMGLSRKEIDDVYDSIVDFSGVSEFIESPVKHYSSGMYVRLGFAVAVHVRPRILIIDEVIAVGDEEFQRKCMDHLYALRKQGVTIIVVTHSTGVVRSMCDRALWLDHGVPQMEASAVEVANAYLDSVNQAEADAMERAEAEAAARGDDTSRFVRPDSEFACTGVEFYDGDGNQISVAHSGAPLTVRIRYKATVPLVRPRISWGVFHESGVYLNGEYHYWPDGHSGLIEGEGWVEKHFDHLDLFPGNYDLSIVLDDENVQHNYQHLDRQFRLTVRPGPTTEAFGMVDLRGPWTESEDTGAHA
jgi:ABC-2 type transport system ATP-binding protein/lipopolysaccharide transport system ATP-binding protein